MSGNRFPDEGQRFEPARRDDAELDAIWEDDGERAETKRSARLDRTLRELATVLADAALVTADGEETFRSDRRLQLAGEAVISHLGEVVSRLPTSYLEERPQVPWPQIAAMRNRVVHEYQHLAVSILWSALSDDIPALGPALDL